MKAAINAMNTQNSQTRNKYMKRMTAFFLTSALLALIVFPAFGEEAELVPGRNLRATLSPSFGTQIEEWEGVKGGKASLFNFGLGVEYGVRDWISAQALWIPGVNVWSAMENSREYGYFNDMFLGGKVGILGPRGLVKAENMRLSAALGIKAPFPSKTDGDWEEDRHLWGSAARVYYDYIFTDLFYLNGYIEGIFYPEQAAHTPNFSGRQVYHPLDMTIELDPRFRYGLPGPGMELSWGFPLTYTMSPWINLNREETEKEEIHRFSAGVFFTAAFVRMKCPFDLTVKYVAPVVGTNDRPIHRVSLTGRVNFDLGGTR
jgi:hypothetical protein